MLHSAHFEYATTRLQYLKSLPKECRYDWMAKMELDILTHLLASDMDLAKRNASKPEPKPIAVSPMIAVDQGEKTYSLHCMTDAATGLVQLQSSQYDFPTYLQRIGVPHDPARSFSLKMDSQPPARAIATALHAFLAPKRMQHPTSTVYWYSGDARALVAAILHYAEGQAGVGSWATNPPPDHGLRMAKLDFNGTSWGQHVNAILIDYAKVMGVDGREGVVVPL